MKIQVGKKELSEKQKKILRKVKVILQYVFIFLSLLIATTVAWVFRTWKGGAPIGGTVEGSLTFRCAIIFTPGIVTWPLSVECRFRCDG